MPVLLIANFIDIWLEDCETLLKAIERGILFLTKFCVAHVSKMHTLKLK